MSDDMDYCLSKTGKAIRPVDRVPKRDVTENK